MTSSLTITKLILPFSDTVDEEVIACGGKHYPITVVGLKTLGCDLYSQGTSPVSIPDAQYAVTLRHEDGTRLSEAEETERLTLIYTKVGQVFKRQLGQATLDRAIHLTRQGITQGITQAQNQKASPCVHMWSRCEIQFDRIDCLLQKARFFGCVFKIRRILTISVIACAVIAAGLVPVPLAVLFVLGMVRYEQASLKLRGAVKRIPHVEIIMPDRQAVAKIYIPKDENDHGNIREEWLRFCRTVIFDYQGCIEVSDDAKKRIYQIRTYDHYTKFVQLTILGLKRSGDLQKHEITGILCAMPTYSEAIPEHLRS